MFKELCTANYAGGWTFSMCGNANRKALGFGVGIYPITPQTEIVETIVSLQAKNLLHKGRIFHVESEHSALATSIGVSIEGARAFTATSSNGALYMAENIVSASLFRLPIVMQIVNRTLGPEWNIWAEQGDSLIFRDWGWIQFYCENNQELVDRILAGFFISENKKVLLPTMVCVDAFILSHTMMGVLLPTQEETDEFLPLLDLPHRLRYEKPSTTGGLSSARVTASHRLDMEQAMNNVFEVYKEAQEAFYSVFKRKLADPIEPYLHDDAEILLITSSTITSTAKIAIDKARKKGIKIGLIKISMFRPFPTRLLVEHTKNASKIAVLDRNFSLGAPNSIGGIFCMDVITALKEKPKLIQSYILGIGGMDVMVEIIDDIIEDIIKREKETTSIWKGL